MKININALIIASVDVVLLVIVTLISNMRETEWIETSFYLYIVSIVVNIIAIREIKKGYINYPMVMYVLLVLFHLSQIYLGYIGIEDYYCIFSRVKFESCQKAFTFAFVCIHVMMISFFLFYRAHEKKTETNTCVSISSVEKKLIKYVFFLFYFIKCIIRVYWFYIGTQIGYISLLRTMSSLPSMIITAADVLSLIHI